MSERKLKVISCGEAVVDLIPFKGPGKELLYERAAGGASANVAAGVAKLGGGSAFYGTAGNDPFGRFLKAGLGAGGVDTSGFILKKNVKTAIAVVSAGGSEGHTFSFYRDPMDNYTIPAGKKLLSSVVSASFVHFTSAALIPGSGREAALLYTDAARRAGTKVSFDVNLRLAMWQGKKEAFAVITNFARICDVLKMSACEFGFLFGSGGIKKFIKNAKASCLIVTDGKKGSRYYDFPKGKFRTVPSFRIKEADPTGCGDAFMAALITGLSGEEKDIYSLLRAANAAGAITASQRGAIRSMPGKKTLEAFLNKNGERLPASFI